MTFSGKLTLFLLCMGCVNVLQAQRNRISLKQYNVSLLEVIERIESQTDYTFLYSDSQVREVKTLNVNFEHAELPEILEYCLKNTSLTYRLEDNTVILFPLPVKQTVTGGIELHAEELVRLKGMVRDEEGRILPGVSIYLKDRPGLGMASDQNGTFTLLAGVGDVVVFSSVGYQPEKLLIKKSMPVVSIVLKEKSEEIEEIQVVGYGEQRKISVVGAISGMSVQGRNFPLTSFSNAIAGSVSGIIGVQRNGEPGEDVSEFWIRGISTFGARDKALILIDGVERTTFDDLFPEDIESFSVLKDATATAIYGARGGNGVVLINTKRGQEGKMQIQLNGKLMLSYLPTLPDYSGAYDYACLANEARAVRGESPLYNEAVCRLIREQLDPDLYPDVDWQKELLKKWTWGSQVNVSCSGGGGMFRYYVGGNYRSNDAAYRETGTEKYRTNVLRRQYAFRTNLDMDITKSTSLTLNFATNVVTMNHPGIGSTDQVWKIQAELNPLVVPIRYSDGSFPCYGDANTASPAVLMNETGYSSEFRNSIETKLEVRQDLSRLLRGWEVGVAVAYDGFTEQLSSRKKMPDLYRAIGRDRKGQLLLEQRVKAEGVTFSNQSDAERRFYFEGKTLYNRTWGRYRLGGLLLFNLSQYTTSREQNALLSIPERYMGLAGRLTCSFRDIYLGEFNFGYNGSGNFPEGQRFGFFPSFAMGWIPSEYVWWKEKLRFISFFKLRYSFGVVGNDQVLGYRFPYITYMSTGAPGYHFGSDANNYIPGITVREEGASKLRWERADKHNIGMEVAVGCLKLEFDYFRDSRKGIFMRRGNIPDVVGITTRPYGNVGRMKNWGYEGTLTYRDRCSNWEWEVRGNFTYSDNKVVDMDEVPGRYGYQDQKGKRLDIARGFIALGYFRDSLEILHYPKQMDRVRPGDLKYKDVNGDGVVDENDMLPIGNSSIPRLQFGIAANVKWKGWELGLFFRGAGAVSYFMGGEGYFPFVSGEKGNILSVVAKQKNHWTPAWYSGSALTENPNARFPRLSYGANYNNFRPSTHWLVNGAYFRLKTAEIGYSFPFAVLQELHLTKLRISCMGDNLYVWDKVKLWDPEQASSNGAVYPLPRSFLLNIQLTL